MLNTGNYDSAIVFGYNDLGNVRHIVELMGHLQVTVVCNSASLLPDLAPNSPDIVEITRVWDAAALRSALGTAPQDRQRTLYVCFQDTVMLAVLGYLRAEAPEKLAHIPADAITACRVKPALRTRLRAAQLDDTPWTLLTGDADRDRMWQQQNGFEWADDQYYYVKPVSGVTSEAVFRVKGREEALSRAAQVRAFLAAHYSYQSEPRIVDAHSEYHLLRDVLVEHELEGPEATVDGIVHDGRVECIVQHKESRLCEPFIGDGLIVSPPDSSRPQVRNVDPGMVACPVFSCSEADCQLFMQSICHTIGLDNWVFHAEVVNTRRGLRVVELNPRPPGGLLWHTGSLRLGVDLVGACIAMMAGQRVTTSRATGIVTGQFPIYARSLGRIVVTGDQYATRIPSVDRVFVPHYDRVIDSLEHETYVALIALAGETHEELRQAEALVSGYSCGSHHVMRLVLRTLTCSLSSLRWLIPLAGLAILLFGFTVRQEVTRVFESVRAFRENRWIAASRTEEARALWSELSKTVRGLAHRLENPAKSGNTNVMKLARGFEKWCEHAENKNHTRQRSGFRFEFPVNYNFGVYVRPTADDGKKPSEDPNTLGRLEAFFNALRGKVLAEQKGADNELPHCRLMAKALGLDCNAAYPDLELGVSWVYVVDQAGYYGIYPGTNEVEDLRPKDDSKSYDPLQRPWYRSVVATRAGYAVWRDKKDYDRSKDKLSSVQFGYEAFPAHLDRGVTHVYQDYSDRLEEVRTYWQEVQIKDENGKPRRFLVCVDFILFGDVQHALKPMLSNVEEKLGERTRALAMWVGLGAGIVFVVGLAALWLASRLNLQVLRRRPENEYYEVVRRLRGFTGDAPATVEIEQRVVTIARSSQEQQASARVEVGAGIAQLSAAVRRSSERVKEESFLAVERAVTDLGVGGADVRGVEVWTLDRVEERHHPGVTGLFWTRVVRDRAQVAMLLVRYMSSSEPQIQAFGMDEDGLSLIRNETESALRRNVQRSGEPLAKAVRLSATVALEEVPDIVRTLPEIQSAREFVQQMHGGRCYFSDSVAVVRQLYHERSIRATCKTRYLRMLRDKGAMDVIGMGTRVRRIIIVQTVEEKRGVVEEFGDDLREFGDQVSYKIVAIEDIGESDPLRSQRELDFSLVARASEAKSVEVVAVTSPDWNDTGRVEGYVSWRQADIRYYSELFEQLDRLADLI